MKFDRDVVVSAPTTSHGVRERTEKVPARTAVRMRPREAITDGWVAKARKRNRRQKGSCAMKAKASFPRNTVHAGSVADRDRLIVRIQPTKGTTTRAKRRLRRARESWVRTNVANARCVIHRTSTPIRRRSSDSYRASAVSTVDQALMRQRCPRSCDN